jgi:chemotaxis protein methyltransferase CheR
LTPTHELENLEIELLLTGIERHWGYDFRGYAPASLRRRVRNAMERERVSTISALQERVLHDPMAMARFVEALSVGVTSMFRDPEFYATLRDQALPRLRTYPFVRIWNAGCSTGEEAYSMAVLLHEAGMLDRCRIYATDISDRALERAQKGIFSLDAVRRFSIEYKRAGGRLDLSHYYISDDRNAIFKQFLRKNLVFSQHNLATDEAFNEFNLILCRNVMIYFSPTLRERVQRLLHASLSRFGMLGLGRKETLQFTNLVEHYQELPGDVRLYRRLG